MFFFFSLCTCVSQTFIQTPLTIWNVSVLFTFSFAAHKVLLWCLIRPLTAAQPCAELFESKTISGLPIPQYLSIH